MVTLWGVACRPRAVVFGVQHGKLFWLSVKWSGPSRAYFGVFTRVVDLNEAAPIFLFRDMNELLEVPRDELRSVVGDDSRLRPRGNLSLVHFRIISTSDSFIPADPNTPENDCTHPTRGAGNRTCRQIETGNIHMPALVRLERLFKAGALVSFTRPSRSGQCVELAHSTPGTL
jgi:hypothetical protein